MESLKANLPHPPPFSPHAKDGGNSTSRRGALVEVAIVLAAIAIAAVAARPFVASANDGSRLATVECLVDYHTFAIDRSIWFERTCDKIRPRPDGPFYSDKPPVMAVLMAGLYQALQFAFGLRAADQPRVFCYLLTLTSSGAAYVVAVWCLYRLARLLGLAPGRAALLTAGLGLATVAPIYACNVNAHLPLLALAMAMIWDVAALARPAPRWVVGRLLLLGALGGFAYALEQPTGGLLLAAGAGAVAVRLRRPAALVWAALAALPWAFAHHALTYACAGTFGPPNANPAFFDYPGSEFNASNLTGRWNHADLGAFASYAFLLLFGTRGIVTSNPQLLLAAPAAAWALWRPGARVEAACFGLWTLGVWLAYAALSTNYSGVCCSVRWFVPLLAPAFAVLALLLRDRPRCWVDFLILCGGGAMLAAGFCSQGPFGYYYDPARCFSFIVFYWTTVTACLLTWAAWRVGAATSAALRR